MIATRWVWGNGRTRPARERCAIFAWFYNAAESLEGESMGVQGPFTAVRKRPKLLQNARVA
jgi:hypothetical protein